jgi:hypothetical protein
VIIDPLPKFIERFPCGQPGCDWVHVPLSVVFSPGGTAEQDIELIVEANRLGQRILGDHLLDDHEIRPGDAP